MPSKVEFPFSEDEVLLTIPIILSIVLLFSRSLAKVIKIYPFVGNEVRNCRYQQSNSISDQIAVCDFCILMKVSEIF